MSLSKLSVRFSEEVGAFCVCVCVCVGVCVCVCVCVRRERRGAYNLKLTSCPHSRIELFQSHAQSHKADLKPGHIRENSNKPNPSPLTSQVSSAPPLKEY